MNYYKGILNGEFAMTNQELIKLLLIDHTTSNTRKEHHIIWATDNYEYLNGRGKAYDALSEIELDKLFVDESISNPPEEDEDGNPIKQDVKKTGQLVSLITPRSQKSKAVQKARTKKKAEVFTPLWIVDKMNKSVTKQMLDGNQVDDKTAKTPTFEEVFKSINKDNLLDYLKKTYLEMTCGEGPYIVSRYDTYTGEYIPLKDRVGFIDNKFRLLNQYVDDKDEWVEYSKELYKASYGYEWSGDSLILARENILLTYIDNYFYKFDELPTDDLLTEIANIITFNFVQMDGLKYIIPMSEKDIVEEKVIHTLFGDEKQEVTKHIEGKLVKIMNWSTGQLEDFKPDAKEAVAQH